MKHQQFQEWLTLSFYEELQHDEQQILSDHLKECAACSKEKAQLEKLFGVVRHAKPIVSEELLDQARRQFRAALRQERQKKPWWQSVRDFLSAGVPQYQAALGSALMLAAGLLIGYFAFQQEATIPEEPKVVLLPEKTEENFSRGEAQITNIKFEDADPSDGEVEFSFEAVTPMKVKGSINDDRVQKVLTYALVNEQNPGLRLRAVNALGDDRLKTPDLQVKTALITALRTDENAGVRKQAMEALQKFTPDQDIKEAYLHVLVKDTNPGMRVSAIKALESLRMVDEEVLTVLRGQLQEEENDFIRLRARAVLQEARQKQ